MSETFTSKSFIEFAEAENVELFRALSFRNLELFLHNDSLVFRTRSIVDKELSESDKSIPDHLNRAQRKRPTDFSLRRKDADITNAKIFTNFANFTLGWKYFLGTVY